MHSDDILHMRYILRSSVRVQKGLKFWLLEQQCVSVGLERICHKSYILHSDNYNLQGSTVNDRTRNKLLLFQDIGKKTFLSLLIVNTAWGQCSCICCGGKKLASISIYITAPGWLQAGSLHAAGQLIHPLLMLWKSLAVYVASYYVLNKAEN